MTPEQTDTTTAGREPAEEASAKRSSTGTGAPKVEHYTPAERAARGKAARADVPRTSHGEWEPPPHRPDPVELLEEQAQSRVPELIPIRYGRMLVSPFAFYRGAAYLMASDLAAGPRTGLHSQLCGDAHLSNFGAFAAPDRRLVFALNDFDETLPGPFEWDVKRLVASFAVAGRDRGFDEKTRTRVNTAVIRSYREAMREFAQMKNLDLWYSRLDVEQLFRDLRDRATPEQRKRMEKNLEKSRTKDSLKAFAKLTRVVDGEVRIVDDPPLLERLDELAGDEGKYAHEKMRQLIRAYRRTLPGDRRKLIERFRYVDAARKVVGVGSVGTRAWVVLMLGRDSEDPLFMQAKEAQASVLEPYLGTSEFANHGQRVVEGQRLMQAASDILLGWLHVDEGIDGQPRDFYIRQLWDAKGSAPVELMEPSGMEAYAKICGWSLAKAHARSGDAVAIGSYLGSGGVFDRALARFAEAYADQNERDYDALRQAVESGRVTAERGL
ncbi:MAG: DUF2252 domain-containing protein [Verrucomicrobiota bacterium]